MKKISAFQSFLVISAAFSTSVDSRSRTWFEARNECAKQNKTLPIEPQSSEWNENNLYWMGYSKRKSNWIQLLGCYPDSEVIDTAKEESMSKPSVGMCQEICTLYSVFAVKFPICRCLHAFRSTEQSILTTHNCNRSCGNIQDQPFTGQCGGEDAYNVYRSIHSLNFTSQVTSNNMCLFIQCTESPTAQAYKAGDCSESYYAACREKVTDLVSTQSHWHPWVSAMDFCAQTISSYLLGEDLILTDATRDCEHVQYVSDNPSSQNWIAVARQTYISIDQGYPITDKNDFIACKSCGMRDCNNSSCEEKKKFTCVDKEENSALTHPSSPKPESSSSLRITSTFADTENTEFKTSITTASDEITSTDHATSSSFEISTPMSGSVEKSVSDQNEIVAAIVTPIVVLFGAVVAFGVIYFRRCKGNAASKPTRSEKPDVKNSETNQYIYVDNSNNNYFVLEPGSHNSELDNTTKSESESPYNDLPEGEYDLLRDKDSRKKVLDDTYATSAKASDYSDYDVTNRNRQTEEDSTYDHAGSNISSVYGYGSVHHQEQDDNPYSKTEY